MTENQVQTASQFIMWDKKAKVFRPAEIKPSEQYIGYDLENNVSLTDRLIFPNSLNLVSSVYLGPITIFEDGLRGNSMSHTLFNRLKEFKQGIPYGIVKLAESLANEHGVPYFGVTVVQTEKDRTWKFEKEEKIPYMFKSKESFRRDEPSIPIEFTLHPTAQLYVPRE